MKINIPPILHATAIMLCIGLAGCSASESTLPPPTNSTTSSTQNPNVTSSQSVGASSSGNTGNAQQGRELIQGPMCNQCHGDNGDGTFGVISAFKFDVNHLVHSNTNSYSADTLTGLADYIEKEMPTNPPSDCDSQCALDIATYLWDYRDQGDSSVSATSESSASSQVSIPEVSFTDAEAIKGKVIYQEQCAGCHLDAGQGSVGMPSLYTQHCDICNDSGSLVAYIDAAMPIGAGSGGARSCTGDCAKNVAAYIYKDLRHPAALSCSTNREPGRHAKIRRLSKREYINTVFDLFGAPAELVLGNFETERFDHFDTDTADLSITDTRIEINFHPLAQSIASFAVNTITSSSIINSTPDQCDTTQQCVERFGGTANDCADSKSDQSHCMCGSERCDVRFPDLSPDSGDKSKALLADCRSYDQACVDDFINTMAPRILRRPVDDTQRTVLQNLFDTGKAISFKNGVQLMLEYLLVQPSFIYLYETGNNSTGGLVELSAWELATKLAYMLSSSTPDQELLALAANGKLTQTDILEQQIDRMIDEGLASRGLHAYFEQWLRLDFDSIASLDRNQYPGVDKQTPELIKQELHAFIDYVVANKRDIDDIFASDYTLANDDLANFYGYPAPGSEAFSVIREPGKHFGIFSQAAFLSTYAYPDETSPIRRGVSILEKVFCSEFGSPPPDVAATPAEPNANATTRERNSLLTADGNCYMCHRDINPLGFLLENYDPSGRWRETENGLAIVTEAKVGSTDVDGTYQDFADFSLSLKHSEKAKTCFTRNFASFALGRHLQERTIDDCVINSIYRNFTQAKTQNVNALVKAIVTSDAFRFKRVEK